jgi:hypothetical protein
MFEAGSMLRLLDAEAFSKPDRCSIQMKQQVEVWIPDFR